MPRRRARCTDRCAEVVRLALFPAIAANPLLASTGRAAAADSPEMAALPSHLGYCANGLTGKTPAVRP